MSTQNNGAVYDARQLGIPKMTVLGIQHMFAMFGATVTVPLITGLPIDTTLLMAGLGTLLFHFISGGKVPAFLGSSFAFIGGYTAITSLAGKEGYEAMTSAQLLPYACLGVACSGLVYLIVAGLIKAFGIKKIMSFFPPIVTGPIIIAIGLGLAGVAVNSCKAPIEIERPASVIENKIAFESPCSYSHAAVNISVCTTNEVDGKVVENVIALTSTNDVAIAGATCDNDGSIKAIDVAKGQNEFICMKQFDNVKSVTVKWTPDVSPWIIALTALCVIIITNIWGKGMIKILPILCGLIVSYVVAVCLGLIDFAAVKSAAWYGSPVHMKSTLLGVDWSNSGLILSAVIAIVPIALATIMEHIGDISAISSTVGKDFIKEPGLHRTLTGDGLATTFASIFGGPANTTYGENTGVLALSKVYDPRVIRIAAIFAILLSFCPKFAELIGTIPRPIVGGISFVLYGMISAVGIRNLVENKIDFSRPRNLIIAAVILVTALGGVTIPLPGTTASLSSLAVASLAGIILNAIFPAGDYATHAKEDEPPKGNTFEV